MNGGLLPLLRWKTALHKLWPPKASRWIFAGVFLVMGGAFLAGDFFFFQRIFANILGNEDIPRVLLVAVAAKLMGLVLLTTLTLLAFSAAVSALSFLYLDEDLSLLTVLPLRRWALRGYRSAEAGINAGYMVALLLAPVVVAYASLFPGSFNVASVGFVGLALYLVIPTAWGVSATVLLARFFPARRIHQLLTVLTLVMVCLLVILFRLARPEALLNPATSFDAVKVLKSIHMPSEALLPSTWLATVVVRAAEGQWTLVGPALLKLLGAATGGVLVLAVLLKAFHWRGFSRSNEQAGLKPGGRGARVAGPALTLLAGAAPAGRAARAILARDFLLFFRDPTQWGQLIILAALVVIYLFNVRYMPTSLAAFRVAVSFWNLATLGLIVSAVAGRFAFTAVGSEGKAYFASRVLPVSAWSYLWAKYLFTAVPLTALSTATLYGSNRFLGVTGEALGYSVFLAVVSSLALSAMALCFGTMDPVFDAKNPAKAAMSAWGLTYMFLSLLYVGGMIVLSAKPVYRYYASLLGHGPGPDYLAPAAWIGATSLVIILTCFLVGARRLKTLEPV